MAATTAIGTHDPETWAFRVEDEKRSLAELLAPPRRLHLWLAAGFGGAGRGEGSTNCHRSGPGARVLLLVALPSAVMALVALRSQQPAVIPARHHNVPADFLDVAQDREAADAPRGPTGVHSPGYPYDHQARVSTISVSYRLQPGFALTTDCQPKRMTRNSNGAVSMSG